MPAGCSGRLVVCPRKARITTISNQVDLRKFAGHHPGGTVTGAVVDNDHLQAHSLWLFQQGFQATTQKLTTVPVDDAHRHRSHGYFEWIVWGEKTPSGCAVVVIRKDSTLAL